MKSLKNLGRVREPIQVYLDASDRALLDSFAGQSSQSRAEVIRIAIRRLAEELPRAKRPGASLATLVGALDAARDVPRDLAARHDEYLYGTRRPARKR
ncbi:MAG: ribbon-helix-helix protein, CopG family [Gemmatimonadales bacterium]